MSIIDPEVGSLMTVRDALLNALSSPSAEDLWKLRAELLQAGVSADARAFAVLGRFQVFLDHLATGSSSREYSELASKLDIGAVGGVVLEQMLESKEAGDLAFRLFTGALSEGLMVLATRQHIRAWEGELAAVYREAAWYLYGELWRWTESKKPELPASSRRELLDRLLAPVHSDEGDGMSKAVLVGLLFQLLLLSYLSDELQV
jgi:hypothetical protein